MLTKYASSKTFSKSFSSQYSQQFSSFVQTFSNKNGVNLHTESINKRYVHAWSAEDFLNLKDEIGRVVKKVPGIHNPWRGGQYFLHPHEAVTDAWSFAAKGNNFLSYLKKEAAKENTDLESYLKKFTPKNGYSLDLWDAYKTLHKNDSKRSSYPFKEFLESFAAEPLELAPYLLRPFGDPEDRMIYAKYFEARNIPAKPEDITVCNGFKVLFAASTYALMTEGKGSSLKNIGGEILVPQGCYQSLYSPPPLFGGTLSVIGEMNALNVKQHITSNKGKTRAIVIVNPNNPDGTIYSAKDLKEIAEVILEHNDKYPSKPIYAISDLIYERTILNPKITDTPAIGSVKGMYPYSVNITAPSKTLGLAAARVGFAGSGCGIVTARMRDYLNQLGLYHTDPVARVATCAAFSLIPQKWIDKNNAYYQERVKEADGYINEINHKMGNEFISWKQPDGGWYAVLRFSKANLPAHVKSSIQNSMDLWNYFMFYDKGKEDTGVIMFPGAAMGYESNPKTMLSTHIMMRVTFGIPKEAVKDMFNRIEDACLKLKTIKPEELKDILSMGQLQAKQARENTRTK